MMSSTRPRALLTTVLHKQHTLPPQPQVLQEGPSVAGAEELLPREVGDQREPAREVVTGEYKVIH